jgi:glycosyl transferase, family 25
MGIPVFVINLKHSFERRDYTTKQLNDIGVQYQIVEAIDGTKLTDENITNNPDFGIYKFGIYSRYLHKEEIGVTLSHLKIYRQIVDEKIGLACILEDDNDYLNEFREVLDNVLLHSSEWDILYIGHRSGSTTKEAKSKKKLQLKPLNFYIGEAVEVPYGAYGYIINMEAAKKLLDNVYPIRLPVDSFIGNSQALGIRTFLLSPPCVINNSLFPSTIYKEQKIYYSSPFGKTVGTFIRKLYLHFPILRKIRVLFYISWNSIFRSLRKAGLIKNSYARI